MSKCIFISVNELLKQIGDWGKIGKIRAAKWKCFCSSNLNENSTVDMHDFYKEVEDYKKIKG